MFSSVHTLQGKSHSCRIEVISIVSWSPWSAKFNGSLQSQFFLSVFFFQECAVWYHFSIRFAPIAGADPGFVLGKGAPLKNNVTDWCESEALKPRLAHAARAYPGFRSKKQRGVFLLPLDGMLVHRRSLPCNLLGFPNNSPVPIYILLGGEGHCESKVSCPRTQHSVLSQGLNPDRSLQERTH